jgi:carnitine monooxygenase subunit
MLAAYTGGLRRVVISQLFPGTSVAESTTVQTYIVECEPDPAERESAMQMFNFLGRVVGDEDMPALRQIQRFLSESLEC